MTAHIDATIRSTDFAAPQASSAAMTLCPYCGRSDTGPFQVLSRHRTCTGETVWTRCACGSLQMRVRDAAGERIAARGRPHRAIR